MTRLVHRIGATALAPALCVLIAACSNLTGLDGTSSYGCKAPDGVRCDSVSGTYYNALQNNLPSQRHSSHPPSAAPEGGGAQPEILRVPAGLASTAASATASGTTDAALASPLRAAPRVMRLWIKPWEDADHDLNGESFVYLQIDNGRWLVDYVQRQVREPYVPIRPTTATTRAAANGDVDAAKAGPGRPAAEDATSLSKALRALEGRSTTPTEN